MIYLLYTTTTEGLKITGYCDVPEESAPADSVLESSVPFPTELSGPGHASTWVQAIEEGWTRFFYLQAGTYTPTLAAMPSWQEYLDISGSVTYYDLGFTTAGNEKLYFSVAPATVSTFLTTNYSAEQVASAYLATWDELQVAANHLITANLMTLALNSFVTSTTVDVNVAGLITNLHDVQANYASEADFIAVYQGGLTAIASALGLTWPLP